MAEQGSIGNFFGNFLAPKTPAKPAPNAKTQTTNNTVPLDPGAVSQGQANLTTQQGTETKHGNDGKPIAKSPLDSFLNLLDNSNASNQADPPPTLSFSPEALTEISSKMSFTSNLPPELSQALSQMGDQGKAILSIMEHVGRQAYMSALQHNSAIVDKFVGMRSDYDTKRLSGAVRKEMVNNSLKSSNTADHPVLLAFKSMVAEQLQAKNPDATPDWINQQTQSFLTALSEASIGNASGATDNKAASDVNWDDWLVPSTAKKQ